jgi:orotate phosphoribosyltransferase
MEPKRVLDLFRSSGAMLEGHFELSSGLHSDRYFQCALLLEEPRRAEALAQALAERLRAAGLAFDVVIGPALGAVTWAYECARALGARGLFAERQNEAMCIRRGFVVEPKDRVLVVEDVITTGGSAREVIEVLRALGNQPLAVGGIVNRSGGNPFEKDGLPLFALADVEVKQWKKEDCPQCRAGGKALKPGSRAAGASAAPTAPVRGGRA